MNYKNIAVIFIMLGITVMPLFSGSGEIKTQQDENEYKKLWTKVEKLSKDGKPRSALKVVKRIRKLALENENQPQIIKTITHQGQLEGMFVEDPLQNSIRIYWDALDLTSHKVTNAFFHSLLARSYYAYYQRRRHKINERTELLQDTTSDIKKWTAKKFVREAIKHYRLSVEDQEILSKTPLKEYELIIERDKKKRSFYRNVYDLLANRALDFYKKEPVALVKAGGMNRFTNAGFFKTGNEFLSIAIHQKKDDYRLLSMDLYQKLYKIHKDDRDPFLKVMFNLQRLDYLKEKSAREDAGKLYRFALENLLETYKEDSVSTQIQYKLASWWDNKADLYVPLAGDWHKMDRVKAKKYCENAIQKFPDSHGAKQCRNLLENIEAVNLALKMDNTLIPGQPSLASLEYRNTDRVAFRIYKLEYRKWRKMNTRRKNKREKLRKIKALDIHKSWSLSVPDKKDFQTHYLETEIPPLDKGHYIILISDSPDFEYKNSEIRFSSFFASNLAIYVREKSGKTHEGYIVNRTTGHEVQGATVSFVDFTFDYSDGRLKEMKIDKVKSDEQGYFELPATGNSYSDFRIEVTKGEDHFFSRGKFYQRAKSNRQDRKQEKPKMYFFTDRSIYRPGQTVYFKGIALEKNDDEHRIKSGFETNVNFLDANGQKFSTKTYETNEYGSFSGSITLPSSGMTGRFRIKTLYGSETIQVEEYKRPRFEVNMKKPEKSYKLEEKVTVNGEAVAYAGAKVSDAKVSYEIKRKPSFIPMDYWYGFYRPRPGQEAVTVKTGQTSTDREGKFTITFKAIPGDASRRGAKTIFRYEVIAEVTDTNGETRSDSRTISAGKEALVLKAGIPDKVDQTQPMQYKLSAENLDGGPVSTKGKLIIERLEQPERLLKQRGWRQPDLFLMDRKEFQKKFPHEQYKAELDKTQWETDKKVFDCKFNTGKSDSLFMDCAADWDEGVYRLTMKAEDDFGQQVVKEKYFTLYSPEENEIAENTWLWSALDKNSAEPGEDVNLILGSAAENAEIHMSYGMEGKFLDKKKIKVSGEKKKISIPVKESMRGGFFIYLRMTKGGVTYSKKYKILVPYTNKKLNTQLVTFRDKLMPGVEETWKIKLSGPEGEKAAAEILASMYDASLDQFKFHNWNFSYLRYNSPGINISTRTGRNIKNLDWLSRKEQKYSAPEGLFREQLKVMNPLLTRGARGNKVYMMARDPKSKTLSENEKVDRESKKKAENSQKKQKVKKKEEPVIRSDFSETAFFYPELQTNDKGEVLLNFTMPESVTRWKFMMLAHTKDLKSDMLTREVVTQKDLMVMPNMPRFFRETDTISVSAKISNLSENKLSGDARIVLMNSENREKITGEFLQGKKQKGFSVKAEANTNVNWNLIIPEGYSAVTWRITAQTEDHSDGEENLLPILTNRMMVTETMPLSVRKNSEKSYDFKKLQNSGSSSTLQHYRYTLEMTQNPAWYAVQALPYLSDLPHECSEQIFSRYYANSLARMIANSEPKIRNVFETWRKIEPDALKSQLEKNPELKSAVLSETPWVMDAKDEAQQKRRIGRLFESNRLDQNRKDALSKLEKKQLGNGGWPWFGGDYANHYITQHIVAGFGHLFFLDEENRWIKKDKQIMTMVKKAIDFMDSKIKEDYQNLKKRGADMDKNHISSIHAHYLYARSFFTFVKSPDHPSVRKAYNYYFGQAKEYWQSQSLYLQGMIALSIKRRGEAQTATKIMESLTEKSLHDEELGMYWRKTNSYYWTKAPIERQALMIEAYDEIMDDQETVEELKLWLLKQKQTQSWESSKATAEAVYALLRQGEDLLTTGNTISVKVGDQKVDPSRDESIETEAGTGYFKKVWQDVEPSMGNVKVKNQGSNVAWGSVYWQYFEQLDKITGHDSPLGIEKELYKEIKTETGRKLKKLGAGTHLQVGDRITVRVILHTDRDMEFVHLKDMRAAGMEPINVISQMKYQDGLRYYQSTKDVATHFFFDRLPKGKYVFEYSHYAAQEGKFSNGITTVQCMYAPEFSAHSEGVRVKIE